MYFSLAVRGKAPTSMSDLFDGRVCLIPQDEQVTDFVDIPTRSTTIRMPHIPTFECIIGLSCDVPDCLRSYVNPEKFHVTWFYAGFLSEIESAILDQAIHLYSLALKYGCFTIVGYDYFGSEKDMPVLLIEPEEKLRSIMDDVAREHGVWRDFQKEEMGDTPYFQQYHITLSKGEDAKKVFEKVKGKTFYSWGLFRKVIGGPMIRI